MNQVGGYLIQWGQDVQQQEPVEGGGKGDHGSGVVGGGGLQGRRVAGAGGLQGYRAQVVQVVAGEGEGATLGQQGVC